MEQCSATTMKNMYIVQLWMSSQPVFGSKSGFRTILALNTMVATWRQLIALFSKTPRSSNMICMISSASLDEEQKNWGKSILRSSAFYWLSLASWPPPCFLQMWCRIKGFFKTFNFNVIFQLFNSTKHDKAINVSNQKEFNLIVRIWLIKPVSSWFPASWPTSAASPLASPSATTPSSSPGRFRLVSRIRSFKRCQCKRL